MAMRGTRVKIHRFIHMMFDSGLCVLGGSTFSDVVFYVIACPEARRTETSDMYVMYLRRNGIEKLRPIYSI